jgi:Mg2+/Co2+ transporter CorC
MVSEFDDGRRLIDAGMSLEEFNQAFGVNIDCEDAETIAGALLDAFGELPATGASIVLCDMKLTVESVEFNRISRVLVEPPAVEQTAEASDSAEVSATLEAAAASEAPVRQAADGEPESAPVERVKKGEGA